MLTRTALAAAGVFLTACAEPLTAPDNTEAVEYVRAALAEQEAYMQSPLYQQTLVVVGDNPQLTPGAERILAHTGRAARLGLSLDLGEMPPSGDGDFCTDAFLALYHQQKEVNEYWTNAMPEMVGSIIMSALDQQVPGKSMPANWSALVIGYEMAEFARDLTAGMIRLRGCHPMGG